MSIRSKKQILIILALLGLALLSVSYSAYRNASAIGGIDFHSYWYAGHFIRQGLNPYIAYIEGLQPELPIRYLFGETSTSGQVAIPGLANVPANTAPMVWLLTPFSFFPWPTAKWLWWISNLVFIIAIPWLLFRTSSTKDNLDQTTKFGLFLAFLALFGTRNIVGNGQTSLFVFLLMLISLLTVESSPLLSGIAFGIALSKYSLALPLFLLYLLIKRYRIVFIGLVVQGIALLALAIYTGTTLVKNIQAYLGILRVHVGLPGIQLASLFPSDSPFAFVSVVMMTIITFGIIGIWMQRNKLFQKRQIIFSEKYIFLILFSTLMLWTLLVAYHRAYDTFVTILFFVMLTITLFQGGKQQISKRVRNFFIFFLLLSFIVLLLPASGIGFIQSIDEGVINIWSFIQSNLVTISLIFMLAISLWFLIRIKNYQVE